MVLDGITGRLIPPGQPAILVGAILSLLNNSDLVAQMRAAAEKRAYQVFSVEQHVAFMEAIYRSLFE